MRRDEVVPLTCWSAFIVFMFVAVSALSAKANAAPASPGEQFAHYHAADICIALDARPTIPGVLGALTSLDADGLSAYEAGVAVGTSVTTICPIHSNLLRQFVAHYRKDRAA